MEVIIRPDADAACALVADLISRAAAEKPELVLGLATGRTMERVYDQLAQRCADGRLDLSRATSFNLDEYVGLGAADPASFRAYMDRLFVQRTNVDASNVHVPDGLAADPEAEGARYDAAIANAGGIDLQLLGIGQSGHIGFNEPLSALRSRTRVKALTPATLAQNADAFGGDSANVPRRAITMGVGTILDSRRCILLATGASKAGVLARAVEGPVTAMIAASALQLHADCVVIVDEAAAGQLEQHEYYRWIFENEPEWEPYR